MPVPNQEFLMRLRDTVKVVEFSLVGNPNIAVPSGKRFVVYHLEIEAAGAQTVKIKSAATNLTGALAISATPRIFKNDLVPVFVGQDTGDNLIIEQQAAAIQIDGFIVYQELQAI